MKLWKTDAKSTINFAQKIQYYCPRPEQNQRPLMTGFHDPAQKHYDILRKGLRHLTVFAS